MKNDLAFAATGWDSENWGRALNFWTRYCNFRGKKVLELGCGCDNGGLSLWAAALGAEKVLCSDYYGPREFTISIHKDWGFSSVIDYDAVDALNMPYSSCFDIVIFKSMLGGIVRQGDLSVINKFFEGVSTVLKPGGFVLFAENLEGSFLHNLFRLKFGAGKNNWRYFKNHELPDSIQNTLDLELVDQTNVGFWGCFGRSEKQRILLGKFDKLFMERFVQPRYRYIQFIVAKKLNVE